MAVASSSAAEAGRNRGLSLVLLKPVEVVFRIAAMLIMLALWSTAGLLVCSFIAIRALLWMSGKNIVNALLDRPLTHADHFTAAILLWPRKVIEFVQWGFGYVDAPPTQARHPGILVLETLLMCFFFVSLIWANEMKPGYLPNVVAVWSWLLDHALTLARAAAHVVANLLGAV